MNLEGLNNRQLEAIKTLDGPMLVLAGAGSGKTKVLTTKVAYLLESRDISPKNILAITFTNKAAKEMKDRIFSLIGREAFLIQISTFHSFGLKILKENYDLLGYESNFTILDASDSETVIKLKVYEEYEKELKRSNAIDFDDLLILPLKLFNEHKEVLQKYQEQYKYVFIDEYQDTNKPQYILSKLISAKYKNITVVGDNDQAIFTWRGADYKNILNFEKDYEDAKVVILDENYRSTKTILKAANNVIKNNKLRKEKNLWTENEDGNKITYYKAFDEKDESFYVIKEIKKLLDEGVNPNDICVLYRANAQSRGIEDAFLENNISYRIVGSFAFYQRKEIKDLLSYLKLIHNEKDDVSLLRVINYPKRGIGTKTIEELTMVSNQNNCSLYDAIESGKELEFKNIIEELKKESEKMSLTEFVDLVLDKTGIRESLKSEKTLEADIRLENLEEFKSITRTVEEVDGIASLGDFLDEISLVTDASEKQEDGNDKVTLMTMHAVKGLEFDYVFVIGVEEGLFPHLNSMNSADELEEERRLCYVAITRARKKLYIINARSRLLYGKISSNVPSRFIAEIGDDLLDQEKKEPIFSKKINREDMIVDNDIKAGDLIEHDKYGKGVVMDIDGSIATIAFSKAGVKKLLKNHKAIKKVGI